MWGLKSGLHTDSHKEEIRLEFLAALDGVKPSAISGLPRLERNEILALLRRQGFSIRQIERFTGISRNIVAKA